MTRLGKNLYGKSRVRLSRITRHEDRHDFNEWTVQVLLEGDFDSSFLEADNSRILPTDTMKNTVYVVARGSKSTTIEEFAMELGDYLLNNNPQVTRATIEVEQKAWERMVVDGEAQATTFKMGGPELQTVHAERTQGGAWRITSGVDGLVILKTSKSAFTGYIKDSLTTLKPATDRILGTRATAKWEYGDGLLNRPLNHGELRGRVIGSLLKEFAAHDSMSVQHTLFDMGTAALAAVPELTRITLTMPNLHHLPADLSPFGLDNPKHIFVPIDEPHGTIEATVER
jgi:urate oxidase